VSAIPVDVPVQRTQDAIGARVFRYSLAVFVAVAVARVQDAVPVLASFRPGKVVMLPLLATLFFAIPRWQLLSVLRTATPKYVAVIAVLGVLSIPGSIWPSNSLQHLRLILLPSLVLFVVASVGFTDRRTAKVCLLTLAVSAGAAALYLVAGQAPVIYGRSYIGGAMDPNDSAALFVSTIPFAMMLANQRGLTRWVGLAMAVALVAGVAKTASRGGLVGLIVVGLILIVQAVLRRRWTHVVAIVACAGSFALTPTDSLFTRLQLVLTPDADYNVTHREGRIEIWKRGIGYMVTHPVLGVGLHSFETAEGTLSGKVNLGDGIGYTAAHNFFLQIGAELGVFGLLAFVMVFWSAAAGCRRTKRLADQHRHEDTRVADQEIDLANATLCSLAGILTTGFFLSLAYSPMTYFLLGVAAGVAAGSPYAWRKQPLMSPRARQPQRYWRLEPTAIHS
jgi:O-antigen ligase